MFLQELLNSEFFILFLILIFGLIIGNISFKGFSLDISAVIFVAMFIGHLGYKVPDSVQALGLMLYIFTVGMQSGPGFFGAFLKFGRKFMLLCLVLISSAFGVSLFFGEFWNIKKEILVGIFNGALTSTPGLAAAIDASGSPDAAVGYGLTYPAGVILVILFLQILPKLMKVNLKKEEIRYEDNVRNEHPDIQVEHLRILNSGVDGKSLKEIDLRKLTGAVVSRVKHKDNVYTPTADTVLHINDLIKVTGTEDSIKKAEMLLGKKDEEIITFDSNFVVNWVLVTNKTVIGKTISKLDLSNLYGATITRVRRSSVDLRPLPNLHLRFGDKLLIAASEENIKAVNKLMGNDEKRLSETNFLPIALGILIGILIGSISLPIFGLFDFSLGITGGVLLSSLILSRLGKTGPIIWSMSGSANNLIRKLGLLLFLAAVGTNAGASIGDVIMSLGWKPIVAGVSITIIPMFIATIFGHFILKLNFITLLGVIAGGMTSTPGLASIDSKTSCDGAAVAYATVYPIALVLMIIFSQLMFI